VGKKVVWKKVGEKIKIVEKKSWKKLKKIVGKKIGAKKSGKKNYKSWIKSAFCQ